MQPPPFKVSNALIELEEKKKGGQVGTGHWIIAVRKSATS
jgi:hypothetical protein